MLVFEADLVGVWGLATCSTELDFTLVQPALVDGCILDIVRGPHRMIQLELFHEAIVGLTESSSFTDLGQSLGWTDSIAMHQICTNDCRRSTLAHRAVDPF
jgi:hypothetical protein